LRIADLGNRLTALTHGNRDMLDRLGEHAGSGWRPS